MSEKPKYTPVEMRTLVEVVRCNECKWYDKSLPYGTAVPDVFYCKVNDRFYSGAYFCAYGERRE